MEVAAASHFRTADILCQYVYVSFSCIDSTISIILILPSLHLWKPNRFVVPCTRLYSLQLVMSLLVTGEFVGH